MYDNISSTLQILYQTHTHPFNGPFSGTTQVSRYQKGKPIWILLKQETVSGTCTGASTKKNSKKISPEET